MATKKNTTWKQFKTVGPVVRWDRDLKGPRQKKNRPKKGWHWNAPNSWETRAKSLEYLGFQDYPTYLKSRKWFAVRKAALARDNGLCVCCQSKADCVHHRRYTVAVLSGLDLSGLASICESCHQQVTFDEDGRIRSLVEADKVFKAISVSFRLARAQNLEVEAMDERVRILLS